MTEIEKKAEHWFRVHCVPTVKGEPDAQVRLFVAQEIDLEWLGEDLPSKEEEPSNDVRTVLAIRLMTVYRQKYRSIKKELDDLHSSIMKDADCPHKADARSTPNVFYCMFRNQALLTCDDCDLRQLQEQAEMLAKS